MKKLNLNFNDLILFAILNEISVFELNKFIVFQLKYATLKKQIF